MKRRGEVITFYSFKGGVGRSMAVANVAVLLAGQGKRVLVLDCDFEAPGLHRYLLGGRETSPRFTPDTLQGGMLEFLNAFREILGTRWPDGFPEGTPPAASELEALVTEVFDAGSFLYTVNVRALAHRDEQTVSLDFVAAARFDAGYADVARNFDWQSFYDLYGEAFPALAAALARRYDYVLIDSRTGVTDVGSICTMLLPDKLVLVFSTNEQSLQGVLEAGWQAVRARQEFERGPLPLFPLLSRVEDNEEHLRQEWIARSRRSFERMMARLLSRRAYPLATYFNAVRIPYRTFYAYGEAIAVERESTQETGSLAQAYQVFVDAICCATAEDAQSALVRKSTSGDLGSLLVSMGSDAESLLVGSEVLLRSARIHQENAAQIMLLRAVGLFKVDKWEEGIEACRELIRRFGSIRTVAVGRLVAIARYNLAIALHRTKRYEEALVAGEEFVEGADELESSEQIAQIMVNRGVAFARLERHEEAIAVYEAVAQKFGEATERSLRFQAAVALFNRAMDLERVGRLREAESAYRGVVEQFDERERVDVLEPVVRAMLNYPLLLLKLGRRGEGVTLLERFIARFGEAESVSVRRHLAMAMVSRGSALCEMQRLEEGLVVYDEFLRRFGEAEDQEFVRSSVTARVNRGTVLLQLKRPDEALRAYEDVLLRFSCTGTEHDELIANARVGKAQALVELGQMEEAASIFAGVVRDFSTRQDLQAIVAEAFNAWGFSLLREGKRLMSKGEVQMGEETLQLAREKLAEGLLHKADHAFMIGNAGYVAFLQGRSDEARELLKRAIELGGEAVREGEHADADLHSLPQDEAFRRLLRSL